MTALVWDQIGERKYETGVDHGVLYLPDDSGEYIDGVSWNGLTAINEKPSGASANAQYADNIKYLNLYSREDFAGTIQAFTYPPEFEAFDGLAVPTPGVTVSQQPRGRFGLSYRSLIGNDVDGDSHGFKLHLVYGATASPSEKDFGTINDTPAPIGFSWDFETLPVLFDAEGDYADYKPTSRLTVDSTQVDADALSALMTILYGTIGVDPRLPLPDEVLALFAGTVTAITGDDLTAPTYDSGTDDITIPTVVGAQYLVDGDVVTGAVHITADTIVTARPIAGYYFDDTVVNEWRFNFV